MLSASVQIEIENVTPDVRRIYVLNNPMPTDAPLSIAGLAWRSWTLASGERGYATRQPMRQLAAQISDEGGDHRTVLVDAPWGTSWSFQFTAFGPKLIAKGAESPDTIRCFNDTGMRIDVGFWNDYRPLLIEANVVPNGDAAMFDHGGDRLYVYCTQPLHGEASLAMEAASFHTTLEGAAVSNLRLQLLLDGGRIRWAVGERATSSADLPQRGGRQG